MAQTQAFFGMKVGLEAEILNRANSPEKKEEERIVDGYLNSSPRLDIKN